MTQENLVRFEFRNIKKNETEQTAEIERICFPPNEACTPEMMHLRVEKVPEMFLVAVDKATGKIAGLLMVCLQMKRFCVMNFFRMQICMILPEKM